ncbi:MAG TPA: hypothetical protein VFH89_04750 [Sphingomicrobium sp.]|nr:hypothetical protein [Sphingomicrobium sp.]
MTTWRPIIDAPTDGSVFEANSLDYGKGPSTTIYRVRRYAGAWINADEPREELEHLFEWREAPQREGLEQLLDSLPIDALARIVDKETPREADYIHRGYFIEAMHSINELKAQGEEEGWAAAIEALASLVHAAQQT